MLHPAEVRALARARQLALNGRGRVSPNPLVGAVVLDGDRTIAEGWHEGPGLPHAEAMALALAGRGPTVRRWSALWSHALTLAVPHRAPSP